MLRIRLPMTIVQSKLSTLAAWFIVWTLYHKCYESKKFNVRKASRGCEQKVLLAVADPGFPVGGGVDSWGGYVSQILYVKKKESGPLGGVRRARPPLNPPMIGDYKDSYVIIACGSYRNGKWSGFAKSLADHIMNNDVTSYLLNDIMTSHRDRYL